MTTMAFAIVVKYGGNGERPNGIETEKSANMGMRRRRKLWWW